MSVNWEITLRIFLISTKLAILKNKIWTSSYFREDAFETFAEGRF